MLETYYAHLSKICVASGQTVTEGQLIGYSGEKMCIRDRDELLNYQVVQNVDIQAASSGFAYLTDWDLGDKVDRCV